MKIVYTILVALSLVGGAAIAADGGGDGCELYPTDVAHYDGGGAD